MKNAAKKVLSSVLCASVLSSSVLAAGASACFDFPTKPQPEPDKSNYKIVSCYDDVIWEGDNAWGAYKGTLHSHTTYSDADLDLPTMVKEYYNQDYDFLGNADHGVTGRAWNVEQPKLLLYSYQKLMGNKVLPLTDEEYEGITTGTYPLYDGKIRGKGMLCVTGANELNNLTLTKCHVNGYFLPDGVGNGYGGKENGYEESIKFVEDNGGLSHINHPGDWLESNKDITRVSDPKNVKYFADILLRYDSCLGIEVLNERNSTTPYDRILWDNLLMATLPYGKNVIGFSNTDAHNLSTVDSSFSVFMMEKNDMEHVKETMQTGAFFAVTRMINKGNDIIGPAERFDLRNCGLPYPMFTNIKVDGHKINIETTATTTVQWIADGKIIKTGTVADGDISLDLDKIEGAEDFTYVRAELFGDGGLCLSQAFVIDDGTAPKEYKRDTGIVTQIEDILFKIKSTRVCTIIIELYRMILDKVGK